MDVLNTSLTEPGKVTVLQDGVSYTSREVMLEYFARSGHVQIPPDFLEKFPNVVYQLPHESLKRWQTETKAFVKDWHVSNLVLAWGYAVLATGNKGNGLIARKNFEKGDPILSEKAIAVCAAGTTKKINARKCQDLPAAVQRAISSLHIVFPDPNDSYSRLFESNCQPLDAAGSSLGLFLDAARINHSCRPNAYGVANENIKEFTVHALKPIKVDEEITIAYHGTPVSPSTVRRAWLRAKWGFDCTCELCSMPAKEQEASDERRKTIMGLQKRVKERHRQEDNPESYIKDANALVELIKMEELPGMAFVHAYLAAFSIAATYGPDVEAQIFSDWAGVAGRVRLGDNHPDMVPLMYLDQHDQSEDPSAIQAQNGVGGIES